MSDDRYSDPDEPQSLRAATGAGNALMHVPIRPRAEDAPYLRRLLYTLAIAAVLIVVWRAADLLLLAFGSILGEVAVRSAGDLFVRVGVWQRDLALGLSIEPCLAVLGLMGYLLTVQFGAQIANLIDNLPETVAAIERTVGSSPVGATVVKAVRAAVLLTPRGGRATMDRALGAGAVFGIERVSFAGALLVVAGVSDATDPCGSSSSGIRPRFRSADRLNRTAV